MIQKIIFLFISLIMGVIATYFGKLVYYERGVGGIRTFNGLNQYVPYKGSIEE